MAAARPRSLGSRPPRSRARTSRSVSVPGEYATLEAHRALSRGLHVFLFSDNVSVERRGRAQAPRRRARPARSWGRGAGRRCSAASASGSPTRCAPGASASSPRRDGRAGGRVPCRGGRRRVADRRRRRPRPIGGGRRPRVPPGDRAARQRTSGPSTSSSSPSRPRGRSSSACGRARREAARSPRSWARRRGTRCSTARSPPARPAAGHRGPRGHDPRRPAAQLLGDLLRRLARPRGGDDPRARGHRVRQRTGRGDGGSGHASSTSARRVPPGAPHPMVDLEVRLGILEGAAERRPRVPLLLDVVSATARAPSRRRTGRRGRTGGRAGSRPRAGLRHRRGPRRTRRARRRRSRRPAWSSRRRTPPRAVRAVAP